MSKREGPVSSERRRSIMLLRCLPNSPFSLAMPDDTPLSSSSNELAASANLTRNASFASLIDWLIILLLLTSSCANAAHSASRSRCLSPARGRHSRRLYVLSFV